MGQVTLCDAIWRAISHSSEVISTKCYIRSYFTLFLLQLYADLSSEGAMSPGSSTPMDRHAAASDCAPTALLN